MPILWLFVEYSVVTNESSIVFLWTTKALSAKHRSNRHNAHDMEVTEAEPSRTPEDSVCSGEGPTDTGGEMSALSVSK